MKDVLELDLRRYEVRLNGRALKLERHPMDLLILLLRRPGELVTRKAIAQHVWGDDVYVDAEQGINTAVRKVRQALQDDPARPSFLQTVVGKGYRFIGSCARVDRHAEGVRGVDAAGADGATDPGRCHLVWRLRTIPLADGSNLIGRDPSSTVWIDSSSVSRRHAAIVVTGAVVTVEDLGSKNGTFLNGHRIDTPVDLADYDTIQVGPAILTCRLPSVSGSTLTVDHH
jgi:DNA-binding winged helix-turn-helix (wHTH) protein